MLTLMICLMVGWSGADGDQLDRGQTIALLRQLRAPILDYECIYEGQETRFEAPNLAGLPEPIRKATERDMAMNAEAVTVYQGKYAYRNDKSIHIDVSVRHPDPKQPLRREILCLFRNKGSKRVIVADRGGVERPDLVQAGGTIFVKKAFSQLRVDMYPYLLESISNDLNPFASAEWGDVDGHRCLVIDFPRLDESDGRRVWGERYWVDVDRGGNVLKYEWDDDGSVTARLSDVVLSRAEAGRGESLWLPVSGRLRFYRNGLRPTKEAQSEQTYAVLHGTLKVNGRLPDSRFTLDFSIDEPTLASAREANASKGRNRKGIPVDAEARVKSMLRDPDDPSKKLVARSISSGSWLQRNGISTAVIASGILLTGVGVYLKRRFE